MTYWSTDEHWETGPGLVTDGCIVVSDCMLEMLCAEAEDALVPQSGELKDEDLLRPFHLLCVLKN